MKSFEDLERRFYQLAAEVSLPTLDRIMFANNLLDTGDEDRGALSDIVRLLKEHKHRTVDVVDAIRQREEVLGRLCAQVPLFEGGCASLEVQTRTLRLVYLLQQRTQRVVEGIVRWRALLTRPYGFIYQGQNYILRIARDSKALGESSIAEVLPLQTAAFPLSSNSPSLSMFTCTGVAKDGSMAPVSNGGNGAATPQLLLRLKRCERVIAKEFDSQLSLLHDLSSLCVEGLFLPVLSTGVVPNCTTGVPINSRKFSLKQASLLSKCYDMLTKPPPLSQDFFAQCARSAGASCDDELPDETSAQPPPAGPGVPSSAALPQAVEGIA